VGYGFRGGLLHLWSFLTAFPQTKGWASDSGHGIGSVLPPRHPLVLLVRVRQRAYELRFSSKASPFPRLIALPGEVPVRDAST